MIETITKTQYIVHCDDCGTPGEPQDTVDEALEYVWEEQYFFTEGGMALCKEHHPRCPECGGLPDFPPDIRGYEAHDGYCSEECHAKRTPADAG